MVLFLLPFPLSSMMDAASSDLAAAAGSSTSIPSSATDLAAVTVAAALSEASTVAVVSIISNATKSSLRAYFEGVNWPLNKALPKGAEFLHGPLGDIMRQFCLVKKQVARQLLNCKKEKYLNTQMSILLNPSDLDKRICKGMAMSTPEFVSSTLLRICNPDPSSYGSDFSNLCAVME